MKIKNNIRFNFYIQYAMESLISNIVYLTVVMKNLEKNLKESTVRNEIC